MRVVVLGGTRFIGLAVVEELAAAGHELLVVHRGRSEPDDLPPVRHLHVERSALAGARDEIARFRPVAAVDTYAMTRRDADCALAALPPGLRLVVLSSIDVYRAYGALHAEAGGETETDPLPLDEASPLRSDRYPYRGDDLPGNEDVDLDRYEKIEVEEAYLARDATVCRLPFVYGERDHRRREEFVLRRVRARRSRIPVGAANWLGSRGYVRDVATGVRLALESEAAAGQVLNLCEERTWTVRRWVEQILAAAGWEAELVTVRDAALPDDLEWTRAFPQHFLVSSVRARDLLGWRQTDPAEAVARSVRWHLAHPPEEEDGDFGPDDRALEAAL